VCKSNDLDLLAEQAMSAAYAYWQAYQEAYQPHDAVVWLRNDETGHLMIFTRGEYSQQLLDAVAECRY